MMCESDSNETSGPFKELTPRNGTDDDRDESRWEMMWEGDGDEREI